MKKSFFLALIAAFVLSSAACQNSGSETDQPTANPTAEVTAEATAEATEEATEEPTEEPAEEITEEPSEMSTEEIAAKVSEYCEAVRSAIDAQASSFENLGLSVDVKSEGSDYITEYTYLQQSDVDPDALSSSLDLQWSTFKNMYTELSSYVGSDDVRVVLRYLNADGTKLLDYVVDKTYHAE